MANLGHLEILKRGVKAWNQWRYTNSRVRPDLSYANLAYMDLHSINLTETKLVGAVIQNANLSHGYMEGASLKQANLRNTKLWNANLTHVAFGGADLRGAELNNATLWHADLSNSNCQGADFNYVDLENANLKGAYLAAANFFEAVMGDTVIVDVNLNEVRELEHVRHSRPSSIGIDTIYKSLGNIPEKFLRGCGLPESFIVQIPALVAAMQPIQFYSCFISYSSKDGEFAKRLYNDLQSEGVRCWFAPEDLKIGDRIRVAIDESIRLHDKLLLVLSENSVSSDWVGDEVEAALEKEERQVRKVVLFPLRLDDAVMEINEGWPAKVRRTRHIGDFSDWKNHDSYKKAFERLMRDLKASG